MPSKKQLMSRTVHGAGLSPALIRLRSMLFEEVTILAYHRVLDFSADTYEFDLDLISTSPEDFRWQMQFLCDHFTPITFSRLKENLDGQTPLPRRPVVVTFDDGFDDNYHHAFPVLRELKMPATVFLSTGYIGDTKSFWFDWLYRLCTRCVPDGQPIRFADVEFPYAPSRRHGGRRDVAELFEFAKRLPDRRLRESLRAFEVHLGVAHPDEGFAQSRPLNWDQVREMAKFGIEFGSHTVTHPVLTNLTEADLRTELADSKAKIEHEIGCPAMVVAYPDGNGLAFNRSVVEHAKQSGYRFGACYVSGVNPVSQLDQFRLRRLHVERVTTRSDFSGMLALPTLLG